MEKKSPYNLEERTLLFAKRCAMFANTLPKTVSNIEYAKQLVRASGSVGANYIEANEGLSKKDALLRLRISRKEAKETHYWLQLIAQTNDERLITTSGNDLLLQEVVELRNIFSSIINKIG